MIEHSVVAERAGVLCHEVWEWRCPKFANKNQILCFLESPRSKDSKKHSWWAIPIGCYSRLCLP